jgi:hypothetical protein
MEVSKKNGLARCEGLTTANFTPDQGLPDVTWELNYFEQHRASPRDLRRQLDALAVMQHDGMKT